MPKVEWHSTAWHRCYEYRRSGSGWVTERLCPIRLRGYSELVMGNVPAKLRKTIDTSLKRGYRLSGKSDLCEVLNIILNHNPIAAIPIGYIGKSKFAVYAHWDDAKELQQALKGMAVMTETFDGDSVRMRGKMSSGYREVYVSEWIRAGGKGSSNQPQLKASFTHARQVIDTYMERDAAVREQIARWCANDDCTIRIPFDSHKEKDNAS